MQVANASRIDTSFTSERVDLIQLDISQIVSTKNSMRFSQRRNTQENHESSKLAINPMISDESCSIMIADNNRLSPPTTNLANASSRKISDKTTKGFASN